MPAMKLSDVVHYICAETSNPSLLGKTKLNKILWYADREHYKLYGTPITDAKYIKKQFGPVPELIDSALLELENQNKIAISKRRVITHNKEEYFAIEDPIISSFTPEQIRILENYIEHITNNHTANTISEETHDAIWEMADIGEEIPLYTIYAAELGELDSSDIEKLRAL